MAHLIARLKRLDLADRLLRRHPLYYSRARSELEAFARLDGEARRDWQHRKVRHLLAAAARTEYGLGLGSPPYLGDWPILEKDAVRERPQSFLTGVGWITAPASTSGTTGTPLSMRRSLSSVAFEQVMLDGLVRRFGLEPTACRGAVLRGDDVKSPADRKPPFWRLANGGRRLIFSSNHLDAQTVDAFVTALRDYAPQVLFAYPTVLESLCTLMLAQGVTLPIPLTVCGSEVLTRETCELARRALGTRVIDYYGQAERVAWADGDPESGYRFLPCYGVVELRFVESHDDGDVYDVIGTGLWNRAMPLVRYLTGDRIRLRPGSSTAAVEEGRESFPEILGRSGDYILAPSGARLLGIDHIPRDVPHVVRAQFVQESADTVTLFILPAQGFDDECRRLLLEHARLKLPPSMTLRIQTTDRLMRNRSGKAPLVIRQLNRTA
jgi:phenylacetate-coenzyme A ligase PaaK-like adenylate-forming protein